MNAVRQQSTSGPTPAGQDLGDGLEALPAWRVRGQISGALRDCSLVIPTFKRVQETRELLGLLVELGGVPGEVPAEVVVVDGSPGDSVASCVAEFYDQRLPFDLLYVRSKPGLTRQRNVGIDVSSGSIVFFLDDDSRPLKGYFQVIRHAFDQDHERQVGGIGGFPENYCIDRTANRRWRLRLALGIVPRVGSMRYSHCASSNPISLAQPFSGLREVDVLPGCAFAFRREVLKSTRFSRFFHGYSQGEDLEMSLRVGQRWKLLWAGDARALHFPAKSGRPTSFRKGEMEIFNRLFIWKRHSARHASPTDVLRLGADVLFVMLCDLYYFMRRPRQWSHLTHAAGAAAGLMRGALHRADREEASARKEYQAVFHQAGGPLLRND